jgi:hypothetical protein
VVEPVGPGEGRKLDRRHAAPGAAPPEDLGLEQAADRLGKGVAVRLADAAGRRLDPGLGQALGGQAVGAGQDKPGVLVLDRAGWHVRHRLAVPDGIVLEFLPSGTPGLVEQQRCSTAERLWPLTNKAVANKHLTALEALAIALSARCRALAAMPEIIKAKTRFGRCPAATS